VFRNTISTVIHSVYAKDTLRVRRRDTTTSDTPVVTDLGEGVRQKILIHQVFNRSVKVWDWCEDLFHPHVPCPWQPGNEKANFTFEFFFGKDKRNKHRVKGTQGRVTQKI
jgi:hypothetical protein